MKEQRINRREFLRWTAASGVGIALAACAQPTPQIIEKEVPVEKIVKETVIVEKEVPVEKIVKETVIVQKEYVVEKIVTPTPVPLKYKEAPMLAERVKAGKLPPVDERLPEEPMVVPVVEKIGKYGGDWRMGCLGPADTAIFTRNTEYENLARWDIKWTSVIPNVAKSWEVNDNATEFTFHLRKGMKWSDGTPVTSEDVYWWYVEATNKELTPKFPAVWSIGGQPPVVTKLDDYTIKFTYPKPFGFFMLNLPQPHGNALIRCSQYRKKFFPGYADEAFLKKKMADSGVKNWFEGYGSWVDERTNPGTPVLYAWTYNSVFGKDPVFICERNPYYWKVDPEGNQLPYIDRQVYTLFNDTQAIVLAALAGEIDYQGRHIATLQNKALFAENLRKADLRFVEVLGDGSNEVALKLNLCVKDPVLNAIFNDKRFRVALSHAVNRQEIVDIVALGQGKPRQVAPREWEVFYSEKMEKQYLEYDPALANKILDEILPKKDAQGIRLRPDGKPLQFTCDVSTSTPTMIDVVQLVSKYWAAVGVRMEPKPMDRSLFYERFGANEHEMNVWGGHCQLLDPGSMVAIQSGGPSKWANAWAIWYETGGKSGIEPPEPMKQNQRTWDEIQAAPSMEKMNELMKKIVAVAEEQFWVMGTYLGGAGYAIVKNKFRNVPESGIGSWRYPDPAPYNTCQFFWDL